jgi:glycosyltransferase involved in cell wall biosynthesis
MRILHVDTGRTMRGGQHQLLLLLRGLEQRGHQQTLLARQAMLERWPGGPPTSSLLREAARQADLIHAHDARAHTLAAALCPGKPLVVSRRVAFPVKSGLFSRWKYRRAARYLAVSRFVAGRLREAGIPAGKVHVVYDGVRLDDVRRRAPREDRAVPSRPVVFAPAVDDPLKGAALLRETARRLDVDLRFSRNLPAELHHADVFVYLTESEGLGSAVLLSMAAGVPIVASRIGGIPELIEDEVHGLLVANEPVRIAEAVQRLVSDRALAERCAEAAYQRACREFRDDIMIRQTEQVYRDVLAPR